MSACRSGQEQISRCAPDEHLLAALVEQAPAAIGAFDADGTALVTNARYRDLLDRGLVAGPAGGERPATSATPEREVCLDDGAYLALQFPIEGADSAFGYGEVLLDVTQRRLRAVSTAMLELEQLKSDLVSTVSHELRTPLSSILGYCELLTDGEFGELDPQAKAMIEVIGRNSRRLSGLLKDLLLLAQLDAPCPTESSWAWVDLGPLVSMVAALVARQAEAAGLRVEVESLGPGQAWVQGDQAQLRHAVMNLATNAVKFAAVSGTVTFRLSVDGTDAILEVIDDGMGIDPEDLPRLADRFYRASSARSRQVQGAGIGLSVVASVVHRHSGDLEFSSPPGEGTTARLRLPLVRERQGQADQGR